VVNIFGSWISNLAKPASDWLEKKLRAVSRGRIHVTNFKIASFTKALYKAPYEVLQKLYLSIVGGSMLLDYTVY
jgi:hypothetical protein